MVSLPINLKPSAKACNNPKIPIILGPLLRCIEAKIFLSNKVKNAIDKIIGRIMGKNLNQFKSIFKKKNIKKIFNKRIKFKNIYIFQLFNKLCNFITIYYYLNN